jgi:hypothetical protein
VKKLAPTLIVAGLLAATASAFAVTERLKLEDSPVLGTRIPALFSPKKTETRIGFRLRREENIRLDIVDDNGTSRSILERYANAWGLRAHSVADGPRALAASPDGLYQVQLQLKDEDRTIEFPSTVRVDSTPPAIQRVRIKHRLFSPDGDHRADQVNVQYTFNEPAYAILYVDGKRVATSFRKKPVNAIQWYGRREAQRLRLALAAQDLAGNVAGTTRAFTVRLRYIDLFKHKYTPRGRILRVRVSTDAKTVGWRLGRTRGNAKPPLIRLPVPSKPGRYTLTVTANGHRARATVVVRN